LRRSAEREPAPTPAAISAGLMVPPAGQRKIDPGFGVHHFCGERWWLKSHLIDIYISYYLIDRTSPRSWISKTSISQRLQATNKTHYN
jgi:hypothetical protein